MRDYPFPTWQVHRGFHLKGVKENTLEAFQQAFSGGAEMIECDVLQNKWGELILSHDASLKRVFSREEKVFTTKAQDLKKLGVPTLEDLFLDFGNYFLNIELKWQAETGKDSKSKVQETLKLIKKYGLEKRVLISSFDPGTLRLVKKFNTDILTALIFSEEDLPGSLVFKVKDVWSRCDFWHLNVSNRWFSPLEKASKAAAVWTVNDQETVKKCYKMGFASIISDNLPQIY